MPHAITWIDRLRIEGTVWALDQRIYDLPRQSRIAKRREVRANLLTAASDVGTSAALRNLGGSRRLAVDTATPSTARSRGRTGSRRPSSSA